MRCDQFSLWYIPSQPYLHTLTQYIQDLSKTWNSAPFTPHVTGFSGTLNGLSPRDFQELMAQTPSFTLKCTGLKQSAAFFKTFIMTLENQRVMEVVSQKLQKATGSRVPYHLFPHLSLLYKDMAEAQRESLVNETAPPFHEIRFDQAWLVQPLNSLLGWRDIQNLGYHSKCHLTSI